MPINSFLYPGAKTTPDYDVANSLRFNDGSSDYLNKTLGTASNRKIFTISYWIKKTTTGIHIPIVEVASSGGSIGGSENAAQIYFNTSDQLTWFETHGGGVINLSTNRVFRDVNAWYHIMYAIDTTQGTSTNRLKLYVNGVQETSFTSGSGTYPSQNLESYINSDQDATYIGRTRYNNKYFDGYMCEVVHIDGTAQAPTDLGEFDSDSPNIWKPKDVSGLTFGTNGFYLDFENASSLGADVSGNSNNFTVNNLTSVDQSTDTCTNNFATLNPLAGNTAITFSEGNLKAVFAAQSSRDICQSGFGVSNGKWYWEVKGNNSYGRAGGITAKGHDTESNNVGGSSFSYGYYGDNGTIYNNNSNSGLPTYATYASNTIGVYLDLDNNKLYFSKDGSLQSTTGISITDPASLGDNFYFPAVSNGESGQGPTFEFNFGSPAYSISSGNTDDNNYGNFEYSPNITGDGSAKSFYALNSRNLAEFG